MAVDPARNSTNSLSTNPPSNPHIPEKPLLKQASRIDRAVKIAFSLLAGALALGALGAVCYLWIAPLAVALIAGAVALAVLGLIVALNRVADKLPAPIAKAIHVIHAIVTETLAVVATGLLYPLKALAKKKITQGAPDERPILLVHGYLHNSSGWLYMMHRLKEAGFKSIYTVDLWHPFRSIDDYAQIVQDKAREIREETGRNDLMMIGHSMGGLVVSKAALTAGPDMNVTDVATLGSPLNGTPVAVIGVGPNARQMRDGSDFTKELGGKILNNDKIRFFEVASKTDPIVPGSFALLGQPSKQQLVLDGIGHLGMLFSPTIADKVIEWLQPQACEEV